MRRTTSLFFSFILALTGLGCSPPELMMWVSRSETQGTEDVVTIKLAVVGADQQPGRGRVLLDVSDATVVDSFVELDGDGLGSFELRKSSGQRATVRGSWGTLTAILEGDLKSQNSPGGSSGGASSSRAARATRPPEAWTPPFEPTTYESEPEPVIPTCPSSSSTEPIGSASVEVLVLNRDGTPARSSVTFSNRTVLACAVTDESGRAVFSLTAGSWYLSVNTTRVITTWTDEGPDKPLITTKRPSSFSLSKPASVSDLRPNLFQLRSGF